MKWLNKLERKWGRMGIPNLMLYITAGMLVAFVTNEFLRIPVYQMITFSRAHILQGQVWRLVTFIFLPPANSILWIIFALYLYYFIGSSLENAWNPFRFTAYYVCGIIGCIIAGFITGSNTNTYLNLSLFFAFAQLFPDHQFLLFFILPIKVKYLAYLNWALFLIAIVFGDWTIRASAFFSLLNFFLFFGSDWFRTIRDKMKYAKRRREFRKQMDQNRNMWQ